jgi:hypothetical protein
MHSPQVEIEVADWALLILYLTAMVVLGVAIITLDAVDSRLRVKRLRLILPRKDTDEILSHFQLDEVGKEIVIALGLLSSNLFLNLTTQLIQINHMNSYS